MKRPLVYVAGPFRAPNYWQQEQNIRRAEEIALELWRQDCAVICPHSNTRFFQGAAPDEVWLEGDLVMVERCDAVVLTPDWSKSEGARVEQAHAAAFGIPYFYWGVPEGKAAFQSWLNAVRGGTRVVALQAQSPEPQPVQQG